MTKIILTEWNSLKPGDSIKIQQLPGDFTFIRAVADGEPENVLWVEVHGGRKGRTMMRAVTPERIIIPNAKALQKQKINRNGEK